MSRDVPEGGGPELERLRAEIEGIDRELVVAIARRVQVARAVASAKRAAGLPILDPGREASIVRRASELGRGHGLDEEDVRAIFWRLIGLCRRAQLEETT